MAPRKKAGPNIGSLVVAVQVSDRAWHQFAAAIDPDVSIAGRTKLPGGHALRLGLEKAIEFILSTEGGPTTREISADLRNFVEKVVAAYRDMRPETRELFIDPGIGSPYFISDLADVAKRVLTNIRETEQEARDRKRNDSDEFFLSNIIWLVGHCSGIRLSFPSKAYYDRADKYPLYRSARAAVKIACALAESYAPAAAPKLKRLRDYKQSTFVSKLLRAHRRPFLISPLLEEIKPPAP